MKNGLILTSLLCLFIGCSEDYQNPNAPAVPLLTTCEEGQEAHAFLTSFKSGIQSELSAEDIVTSLWAGYPDLIEDSERAMDQYFAYTRDQSMGRSVLDTLYYLRNFCEEMSLDLTYPGTQCTAWLKTSIAADGSIQELPEAEWKCLKTDAVNLALPGHNEANKAYNALDRFRQVTSAVNFDFTRADRQSEALELLETARTNWKDLHLNMSCDTSVWLP